MNTDEQKLLAVVIDRFAERFGKSAVLRGGMVLKLLGSPRYTNDLDYIFVPYSSKNEIVKGIVQCLKEIPEAEVQSNLNSQCLRVLLSVGETTIQIEVKVAQTITTAIVTNRLIAQEFNLPKRAILIVDHRVSMANKLAAWNERRLARDLYDIWFFLSLNIQPDPATLSDRLKEPRYSKSLRKPDQFTGRTLHDFFEFVRLTVSKVTDKQLESELADYLTPDELEGLTPLIRASLIKLQDVGVTDIAD